MSPVRDESGGSTTAVDGRGRRQPVSRRRRNAAAAVVPPEHVPDNSRPPAVSSNQWPPPPPAGIHGRVSPCRRPAADTPSHRESACRTHTRSVHGTTGPRRVRARANPFGISSPPSIDRRMATPPHLLPSARPVLPVIAAETNVRGWNEKKVRVGKDDRDRNLGRRRRGEERKQGDSYSGGGGRRAKTDSFPSFSKHGSSGNGVFAYPQSNGVLNCHFSPYPPPVATPPSITFFRFFHCLRVVPYS